MKYIIEENGQIIVPRGRKFYYPPLNKWVEDKYLSLWTPEKLMRLGVYKLIEGPSYDPTWYRRGTYTDVKDGYTITRTYNIVTRYGTEILGVKNKLVKKEGIKLYAKALKIEPLLLFTGDSGDIASYKAALIAAYDQAKVDVQTILDGPGTQLEKYDAIAYYTVDWPELPLSEEDLADYGL